MAGVFDVVQPLGEVLVIDLEENLANEKNIIRVLTIERPVLRILTNERPVFYLARE